MNNAKVVIICIIGYLSSAKLNISVSTKKHNANKDVEQAKNIINDTTFGNRNKTITNNTTPIKKLNVSLLLK